MDRRVLGNFVTAVTWSVSVLAGLALPACGSMPSVVRSAGGDAGADAQDPPTESGQTPGGPGMCSAVDMLFLIDNSSSMIPKQQKLAAAIPSFIDAMFEKLPHGTDLHVGITTTDFDLPNVASMEGFANCHTGATPAYILQ